MSASIGRMRKSGASSPRHAALACALVVAVGSQPIGAAPAAAQHNYTYPVGAGPQSIAAGDLNRDGRPDLVTANVSVNSVSVLLNRGAGRFDALPDIPVPGVSSAVIADLNGDGLADLVVAGAAVSVLLGNGDGTFQRRVDSADTTYFSCVAVGDVNHDGRPDVVAGKPVDDMAVFLGNGDGTLGPAMYFNANPLGSPATVPGTAEAAGSRPPWRVMKPILISGVVIGDLNGDGHPDIAVSLDDPYGAKGVQVLIGNGNGSFSPAAPIDDPVDSYSIAVADFNRDGWLDLALADGGYRCVSVILNPRNGALGPVVNIPSRSGPLGVATGDLNRDGSATS